MNAKMIVILCLVALAISIGSLIQRFSHDEYTDAPARHLVCLRCGVTNEVSAVFMRDLPPGEIKFNDNGMRAMRCLSCGEFGAIPVVEVTPAP